MRDEDGILLFGIALFMLGLNVAVITQNFGWVPQTLLLDGFLTGVVAFIYAVFSRAREGE